jgi:hypothetical protein
VAENNSQKILEAAQLMRDALRKLVASPQGVHAETLVAAAARMAGTMLFRSFGLDSGDLRPGSVVLSEQANRRGPLLMETMFATLRRLGHTDLEQDDLKGARETTALSRLSLAETQRRLEPWYRKTQEVCGLSLAEAAGAGAIATALVIHDSGAVLDLHAACAIAVYGMVESLKTVPATFDGGAGGSTTPG